MSDVKRNKNINNDNKKDKQKWIKMNQNLKN